MKPIGRRDKRIALATPGVPVPDGDGGYTQTPQPLDPAEVFASLEPATGADSERVAAGTVLSSRSYVVTLLYHPQVTTKTVLTYAGRTFTISGVANVDEANRELILVCDEAEA
jgi:SPP1 family predicted phage head-tail adaptor